LKLTLPLSCQSMFIAIQYTAFHKLSGITDHFTGGRHTSRTCS
jgi:hypothetical protein